MKVEINIDASCSEPKIVVHTDRMTPEIEALMHRLSAPQTDMIAAQTEKGMEFLPTDAIIRIYSERQKVFAQTAKGIFSLRARLYEWEEKLSDRDFVRISNSEIVNVRMITGMDFSLAGTIGLSLKGGIKTYVARRRMAEFKKRFDL